MSETRKPRGRDERGRLLPAEDPSDHSGYDDYSRYVIGDRDPAALDAKAAHERGRRALAAAARRAARHGTAAPGSETVIAKTRLAPGEPRVTFRLPAYAARALDGHPGGRSAAIQAILARHGITTTAGLDAAARDAGVTRSEHARSLVLDALGDGTQQEEGKQQ